MPGLHAGDETRSASDGTGRVARPLGRVRSSAGPAHVAQEGHPHLGTAWLAMDCKPIVADCGPADAP